MGRVAGGRMSGGRWLRSHLSSTGRGRRRLPFGSLLERFANPRIQHQLAQIAGGWFAEAPDPHPAGAAGQARCASDARGGDPDPGGVDLLPAGTGSLRSRMCARAGCLARAAGSLLDAVHRLLDTLDRDLAADADVVAAVVSQGAQFAAEAGR